MTTIKKKCKHGLKNFCCACKYGKYGLQRSEDNPRDLVDDLKISLGCKLVYGFNLKKDD